MADRVRQKVRAGTVAYAAGRDLSVGAATWESPLPGLLPHDIAEFTGREDELRQLTQLVTGGQVLVTAIDGIAGVGKTALALHAAHQLRPVFPDGQLYADLRGYTEGQAPAEPGEVLEAFLRRLGVPADEIPGEADERSGMLRSLLTTRRVLVVLDNAASEAQVRPLLPGAGQSLVLITSRSKLPGLLDDVTERINLDVLPEMKALELLTRLIGPARVAAEPEAVARIAQWCGRLPLALRIAAQTLAAHPAWPVARVEQRLAHEGGRLASLNVGDRQVRATFEVSYRQLADSDRQMFRLLGLHPGRDFDAASAAALAGIAPEDAEPILERLTNACLVTDAGPDRIGMHDLLRLFARDTWQNPDDQAARNAAEERLVGYYAALARFLDSRVDPMPRAQNSQHGVTLATIRETLARFTADRHCFLWAADLAFKRGWYAPVWQLSDSTSFTLSLLRYLDDSRTLHGTALAAARAVGNADAEGRALNLLGRTYFNMNWINEAVSCHEKSLTISRESGNRREEADALYSLGRANGLDRRHQQAIQYCQKALQIYREIGDRTGEGDALRNIGVEYGEQLIFNTALSYYSAALAIAQETGDRYSEAVARHNIGATQAGIEKFTEAVSSYKQAMAMYQEAGDRYGEGLILENLGGVYQNRRRYKRAAAYFREAAAVMREVGEHAEAARLEQAASGLYRRRWFGWLAQVAVGHAGRGVRVGDQA